MAGIHKYTSSLFVQQGSTAQFKNGIEVTGSLVVDGTITAESYLDINGNPITGEGGGVASKFFVSGKNGKISQSLNDISNPLSEDQFFEIVSSNKETIDNVDLIRGDGEFVIIQTTGSSTFTPNFFNFLKVGDDQENLITVQQGSANNYTPNTVEERKPGVHRYIIYSADTSPGGETHQVFHTITLNAFSNIPPTIVPPTSSLEESIFPMSMSLDHDVNSASLILYFTNSFDENQTQGQEDFIKSFKVVRETSNPASPTSAGNTTAGYNLNLNYSNTFTDVQEIEIEEDSTPGLAATPTSTDIGSSDKLHFTASLTNYVSKFSTINLVGNLQPQTEQYSITLKDNNEFADTPGITNSNFTFTVFPPSTASIKNIKVEFEGNNNNGGLLSERINNDLNFTSHTHTLLYDNVNTILSSSITDLNDRYTSSIVRIMVSADINEPPGFENPAEDHYTKILIRKSIDDSTINYLDDTLEFFTFKGGETTASLFGNNMVNSTANTTESNGFTSIELTPNFATNPTQEVIYIGARTDRLDLNSEVQHGDNNHHTATHGNGYGTLTINKCPNILVDDIEVEVQNPQGSNTGTNALTTDLIAGFTSSLSFSDTSVFTAENTSNLQETIDQSQIKLRIKAKITEPFGPGHNPIEASFLTTPISTTPVSFTLSPGSIGDPGVLTSTNSDSAYLGDLDLSSYIDNINLTTINITNIELRGDFGGTGEYLETFTVGNIEFGNLRSGADGDDFISVMNTSTPVDINSGNVTISYDPTSQVKDNNNVNLGGNAYEIRITFEYTPSVVIESTNYPFTFDTNSVHYDSVESLGYTTNHTHTGVGQSGKELLVSSYTSSWHTVKIPAGQFQFSALFTSSSNAGSTLDTSNAQPTTITIGDVADTVLDNLVYEVETVGMSGIGTNTTTRTVLYGDSHVTNDTNVGKTWENHPLSSILAQTSVTRFRVSGRITEPFGAASSNLLIQLKESDGTNIGNPFNVVEGEVATFSSEYNEEGQLVTEFTSNFIGQSITTTPGGSSTHTVSSSIVYTFDSNFESTAANNLVISPATPATLTVNDTPPTEIKLESFTETLGGNGIETDSTERTVLYGDDKITSANIDNFAGHEKETVYKELSLSRFRIKALVTEPLGFIHHPTTVINTFTSPGESNKTETLTFETGSSNTSYNSHISDASTNYKVVSQYTSSFIGKALESNVFNTTKTWTVTPSATHEPTDSSENGKTILSTTTAQMVVNDTERIIYTNMNHSVEGLVGNTVEKTVLYGDNRITNNGTGSGDSGFSWGRDNLSPTNHVTPELADVYANQSVTRFRVQFTIIEPVGYIHYPSDTTSSIRNSPNITFERIYAENITKDHPNVTNPRYNSDNKFTYDYDSGFIGKQLSINPNASPHIFTLQPNFGLIGLTITPLTGSDQVSNYIQDYLSHPQRVINIYDTPPTEITDIKYQTETFGYSEVIAESPNHPNNEVTRVVLYGDSHITNDGTGSVTDTGYHFGRTSATANSTNPHPMADVYASQSVSRFKTSATITEPVGPLHHNSNLILQWSSSLNDFEQQFNFNSESNANITVSNKRYNNNQLSYDIETEWIGQTLETDNINGITYTYTGSIDHNPSNENGSNLTPSTDFENSKVIVKDTDKLQVIFGRQSIESYGGSNIPAYNPSNLPIAVPPFPTRTILTGETTTAASITGIDPLFTASAVLRISQELDIIEPLGYAHKTFKAPFYFTQNINLPHVFGNEANIINSATNFIDFTTSSLADLGQTGYNEHGLLTSSYTSSFDSGGLEFTSDNYHTILPNTTQNSNVSPGTILDNTENILIDDSLLLGIATEQKEIDFTVANFNDTFGNITISDVVLEIETYYDSGILLDSGVTRETAILHGRSSTETNIARNNSYPNEASRHQLIRGRVRARLFTPPTTETYDLQIRTLDINETGDTTQNFIFAPDDANVVQSDSNGITRHYTSSLTPLQFTVNADTLGNNFLKTYNNYRARPQYIQNTTTDIITFMTDGSITFSNSTAAPIKVFAASSSIVTTTIKPGSSATAGIDNTVSSSFVNPNDPTQSLYFVYPQGSNGGGYSGNSKNVKLFPNTTLNLPNQLTSSILTHENGALESTFTFTQGGGFGYQPIFGADGESSGTGSFNISNINIFNNEVKHHIITLETEDISVGGGSDTTSIDFYVIPAKPQSMSTTISSLQLINNKTLDSHPAAMQADFYVGSLPTNLGNYKPGGSETPTTTSPEKVTNIYRTNGDSTPQITLHTHPNGTADYTGNYDNNNRAYDLGDSGSLVVTINGNTAVNYNLQSNFNVSNNVKNGSQLVNTQINFTGNSDHSGKGYLKINKVAPFNNVSQSIFSGRPYPNGYQAWDATIVITGKIRSGYNSLTLEHTFPDDTPTQTINAFEWYYDEGTSNPTVGTGGTIEWGELTEGTSPTISLSGVSFFKENSEFLLSFTGNKIQDIAHNTYRDFNQPIGKIDPGSNLYVNSSSAASSNSDINIKLNSSANKKGLTFVGLNQNDLVPTSNLDANIRNLRAKAVNVSSAQDHDGETRNITFTLNRRNVNQPNTWTNSNHQTLTVGRFADTTKFNLTTSTATKELFNNEDRRWSINTVDSLIASKESSLPDDFENYWPSTTYADYNSLTDITSTKDLQQTLDGRLQYPLHNYSVSNPNSVNYSNNTTTQGDRRYYRGFHLSNASSGDKFFEVAIKFHHTGTSTEAEDYILAENVSELNIGNVRIEFRLPGEVKGNGNANSSTQPGTNWGVINCKSMGDDSIWSNGFTAFKKKLSFTSLGSNIYKIIFRVKMQNATLQTQKVVMIKAVLKTPAGNTITTDDYITEIELLPDGTN